MKSVLMFLCSLAICSKVLGHEGHGIPGALPPAIHGGVVQEAKHDEGEHEHGEKEADEPELFFEAKYKKGELEIYPLTLPKGVGLFKALSPKQEFSSIAVKIELPRLKQVREAKPIVEQDVVRVPFEAKNYNRFIIHITAVKSGEEKRASIQLENE